MPSYFSPPVRHRVDDDPSQAAVAVRYRARLGNELLRGLVQAHQRVIGIVRPSVDGQHIFHGGYEGAVGLRRDDPALPVMRLETVFLSVRPIVESLARSTMPSSTTLLSSRRNVQRA